MYQLYILYFEYYSSSLIGSHSLVGFLIALLYQVPGIIKVCIGPQRVAVTDST